ncbi:unnamed protein product, partial [Polarella glacialis]
VAPLRANLASALCAHEKYKEAEAEYEKALAVARGAGDRRVEANVLVNLANLYDGELNSPEKAREFRQALADLRSGGTRSQAMQAPSGSAPCAICLEALDPAGDSRKPVVVLPCRHAYHRDCWDGCLAS